MISKLFRQVLPALAGSALALAASSALALTLQPDESASKDVLLYEFDVPGVFGIPTPPRTTNLDTETLDTFTPAPVPFGNFLGSAETDPFSLTPGGPLRRHGTRSLLQFDLSGIGLTSAQVKSAKINLYGLPALRAFNSPTAEKPVTVDLRQVTEDWDEQLATWENDPSVAANLTATVLQAGVDQWLTFDITELFRLWLDNPATNFGVEVSQRDVVELAQPDGARDRYFASLYASSAFADPDLRPSLEVAPVPLPAAFGLLAAATAVLGTLRLRRRAAA